MKKIKILRIIARLNIGGPSIHTILLTDGLEKARFDSLLVCGRVNKDEGDMGYLAEEKNVKLALISELKRELNIYCDILAFIRILKIIFSQRPNIIHTHTAKAGCLGRLAGIFYNFFIPQDKKAKIIHTFHGHVLSGYFGPFKTKTFILIERLLALFSAKILTVSESVKNELVVFRICPESKIEVIPLGFELERFLEIPPRERMQLNIGIVGRLVPIKNHRLFLDAVSKIIKSNPDMQLNFKIVGDGELRQELQLYCRQLNIGEKIEFLGWQKDLTTVYSDLDIVALTSVNEGTPVSLIEAMASARAVVATDVGGVRDLLGKEIDYGIKSFADFKLLERGILVKPHDAFSFSSALILLFQNKWLRQKIGLSSRDYVRTKYARERLIKDIEALYNKVLIS